MGYICICVYVCVYGILYVCVYIYIYMWYGIYMYVCIYIPYTRNTHNEILLSHKKGWNFVIFRDMNGLGRHYAKWNKSEKDKYCITSLICET